MYHFEFTSTLEDLLEAEEAERSIFLRRPFRWVVMLIGVAWLGAGVVTFLAMPAWRSIVWTCLGALVLFYLAFRPYWRRRQIEKRNARNQTVVLEFGDRGVDLDISGVGRFTRGWDELAGITNTPEGILFYFIDGIKNWLPKRVFESELQRNDFLEFLSRNELRHQSE